VWGGEDNLLDHRQPLERGRREGEAWSSKQPQRRHARNYPRDGPGTRSVPREYFFVFCGISAQRLGGGRFEGALCFVGEGPKRKKWAETEKLGRDSRWRRSFWAEEM